jgi:predicted nucleic acid-binding protein
VTTAWLIDKPALVRLAASSDAREWLERIGRALVHVSTPTLLELGYSARSSAEWTTSMTAPPAAQMPIASITPDIEARAVEVQGILARVGQHRTPSIPDLLVAATAELTGLTVLHVDKDFDLVAGVTGQPVERLDGAF